MSAIKKTFVKCVILLLLKERMYLNIHFLLLSNLNAPYGAIICSCKSGFVVIYATHTLPTSVTPTADINDMKICYVLVDGSNATSDIFYFTIEDSGKAPKAVSDTCVS